MTKQELKTILADIIESENELIQLTKELLQELFPEHGVYMKAMFDEDFESGREYNGTLQGLYYYKKLAEAHKNVGK